ncbi:NACHT domain-containing protein [Streptomyces sp. NPDC057638]|uniref:NACHT domain-containing protein n=1 Tax=Streptomyces sp. NPDC057638 TaxID=3346190 RepID=UPI00367EED1C
MEQPSVRNRFSGRARTVIQTGQVHGDIHLLARPPRGPVRERSRRLAASAAAADTLADAVDREWAQVARDRKLYPAVEVRWGWRRRPPPPPVAGSPFEPLPGTARGATADGGGMADLLEVYAGSRSGRLIVLGTGGSGKSAAAILTVRHALRRRRERADGDERAAFPVPVLLTVTGWEHHRQHFNDWLTDQLETRYPFLRRRAYGRDTARRLIEDGRIALFLDGFDEMAPPLGRAALEAIDHGATYRVVIFSRPEEFDLARAGQLRGAAELTLSPVRPEDAVAYVRHCHGGSVPEPWDQLTAHLTERPHSALSRSLGSPLTLSLVHDAFADPSVRALLADGRFAPGEDFPVDLLDLFMDRACRPDPGPSLVPYEAADIRRRLAAVAAEMRRRGTHGLEWRRLHWWASPLPRVAAVAALGLTVGALCGALIFGPGGYRAMGHTGPWFGARHVGLQGLLFALLVGAVSESRDPRSARLRRLLVRGVPHRRSNPAVGLLVGVAVMLAVGNQAHYAWGLPAGLAVGLLAAFDAARVHPDRGRTALSRLRALGSRVALGTGGAAGASIGLAYGFTKNPGYGLSAGLVGTLALGAAVGAARLSYATDTPTDPGTSWGRDLRNAITFGAVTGLSLGLAFGYGNARVAGWGAGVITTLGHAVPIGLASAVAVSDSVRTALVFLQLSRRGLVPVRGMRFLRDAHRRGVLRSEGTSYQFRHARLQEKLASDHDEAHLHGGGAAERR